MLKIIAAVAANRVIGLRGQIPWYLNRDLRRFKELTMGHPVVMGRKTFDSLWQRNHALLPGRENVVLTRYMQAPDYSAGATLSDWDRVVERSKNEDLWIIGGAEVYALALPIAQEMYLTRVHALPNGDVYFPEWDKTEWECTASKWHNKDDRNEFDFQFVDYRRRLAKPVP